MSKCVSGWSRGNTGGSMRASHFRPLAMEGCVNSWDMIAGRTSGERSSPVPLRFLSSSHYRARAHHDMGFNAEVEAPHSNVRLTGEKLWFHSYAPRKCIQQAKQREVFAVVMGRTCNKVDWGYTFLQKSVFRKQVSE